MICEEREGGGRAIRTCLSDVVYWQKWEEAVVGMRGSQRGFRRTSVALACLVGVF